MILTPLFRNLRPLQYAITPNRKIRPSIKINKDKFQISLDVRHFKKEEIRVKAKPDYILVEGKQERSTDNGFLVREFSRKFKLPSGCNPEKMQSALSHEGILTVTALRDDCDQNFPCEVLVPTNYSGPQSDEPSFVQPQEKKDPCAALGVGTANEVPDKAKKS